MYNDELKRVLEIDKKMKKLCRLKVPTDKQEKLKVQRNNSSVLDFDYHGHHYRVIQETDCDHLKIGYAMTIYEDGRATRKGTKFLQAVVDATS